MNIGTLKKISTGTAVVSFIDGKKDYRTTTLINPYGIDSTPPIDTRVLCGSLNGVEKETILGVVEPSSVSLGETKIYNHFGATITLDNLGKITLETGGNSIEVSSSGINIKGLLSINGIKFEKHVHNAGKNIALNLKGNQGLLVTGDTDKPKNGV